MMIAEESTAWGGVSRPTYGGGLGFGFKWNMGWMHDTLRYFGKEPIHRQYHHNDLTFGLLYAWTENFILPLSHDEVVHGKGSMLDKMPGDRWQKFANLRALYAYMWAHPGKKLLFMGGEFGQWREWQHDQSLDWHVLMGSEHAGLQRLVKDLNALYKAYGALYRRDEEPGGFTWIDASDSSSNIISFYRSGDGAEPRIACVCNFSPVPRQGYRVGLPSGGRWEELLNSDAETYAGSNVGNQGSVMAEAIPWNGQPFSAAMTLPPLAVLWLKEPSK
jgi:1,4-alpha-glucan branching enzyme